MAVGRATALPTITGYATSGSASSSLGWTGEQTDSNGFVYLRARYYAPGMGRFTQMDPSRQERNGYQYGLGNPIMLVDPSDFRAGMVDVPYVDEETGRPVDIDDLYGWQSGNERVLSASARRSEAAKLAHHWAKKDAGSLPWAETAGTKLSSGAADRTCNDCVYFVSSVLWWVGFRMKGIKVKNRVPEIPDMARGWANAKLIHKGYPGSTDAFRRTAAFGAWWTTGHTIYGFNEAKPRAYLQTCTSVLECVLKANTLQKGDVILYDYSISDQTKELGLKSEHDWDHAAMVIGNRSGRIDVASRGGRGCDEDPDGKCLPNTYWCDSGTPFIDFLNPAGIVDNSFASGGLLRVGLMHVDYEGYQP